MSLMRELIERVSSPRASVRYDPECVAGPTDDPGSSSYGGFLGTLFVMAVVMGTWGGVRQSRWDREYGGE